MAAFVSVPNNYICIKCGQHGDHWIMECPLIDPKPEAKVIIPQPEVTLQKTPDNKALIISYQNQIEIIKCKADNKLAKNRENSIYEVIRSKLIYSFGLKQFDDRPFRWTYKFERIGYVPRIHAAYGQRPLCDYFSVEHLTFGQKFYLQQAIKVNIIHNDKQTTQYAYLSDNVTWIAAKYAKYVPSDVIIKYKNKRVSIWNSPQIVGFEDGDTFNVFN